MATIAIQTAVGPMGQKATTLLSYGLRSMCNMGKFQYGANEDGLFLLNQGEDDAGRQYERSFTLATSDYGVFQPKRFRFVYIGIEADTAFIVSVKADDQDWRTYRVVPRKTGLQRIRVPIGRDGQGRYWTVRISSTGRFRVDHIDGMMVVRSSGIGGY